MSRQKTGQSNAEISHDRGTLGAFVVFVAWLATLACGFVAFMELTTAKTAANQIVAAILGAAALISFSVLASAVRGASEAKITHFSEADDGAVAGQRAASKNA